jgi:hypothetical protein
LAESLRGEFAVEATTINPTMDQGQVVPPPEPKTTAEIANYVRNYLPIRYAGPLITKLKKRYWEYPDVAGMPLVIAIQDFHSELSMTYSGSALQAFLYGLEVDDSEAEEGSLSAALRAVGWHQWGVKKIKSGFFNYPDSEHISAVIFNSSGTLAKFDRMGVKIGLGSPTVMLIHSGVNICVELDSSVTQAFSEVVTEGYPEEWIDGMDVYHNPNAIHPFDPDLLPGAAHHRLFQDGQIGLRVPSKKLITSNTVTMNNRPNPEKRQ